MIVTDFFIYFIFYRKVSPNDGQLDGKGSGVLITKMQIKSEGHQFPESDSEMRQPDFWLDRTAYTGWLRNPFHLFPFTPEQAKAEYEQNISQFFSSQVDTAHGRTVNRNHLMEMLNSAEQLKPTPTYGLMVMRTNLKQFPVAIPLFAAPRPGAIDRNQLSGLEVGSSCRLEAVAADGRWFLVTTRQGMGWVPERAVAIAGDTAVDHHTTQLPVIVTLEPLQTLQVASGENLTIGMGSHLPALDPFRRIVLIPTRAKTGKLVWREARIDGGIACGHLAPTLPHLLKQAFKYLGGHRYAWGDCRGQASGIDCSRFVQNVLATLGWEVPRSSQAQLQAGKSHWNLRNLPAETRREVLAELVPGSLIFTDSHGMIFLGETDGSFYALHAFDTDAAVRRGCTILSNGKRVVVSALSLGAGSRQGSLEERLTAAIPLIEKDNANEAIDRYSRVYPGG